VLEAGIFNDMSTFIPIPRVLAAGLFLAILAVGCETTEPTQREEKKESPPAKGETRKVEVGKNVYLEVQGERRRVLINSEVCLRNGPLELLVCRNQSKEHESILHADVDARDIHKALLVTGAKPGKPCKYLENKIEPATGTTVKISLQYEQKGKLVTVPAGRWVRNMKTGKELDENWVFAGSAFAKNPFDPKKPDIYLANEGDMITVSNFEDAMLDLPIPSSKDDADRAFEANTEKIPPLETKVTIILEPVQEKKKPQN
jgi:hypothetical protein